MKRKLLGLVMSGGESRRMGRDKASLEVRPGVTQLEYICQLLGKFCERVAVSTGPRERGSIALPDGVESISDVEEIGGPMSGVVAGLRAAAPYGVLAVAVDMPFVETSHLLQLLGRRDETKRASAFVAEDGSPDPMCAIYEAASLPELEKRGQAGRGSLRRYLQGDLVERIALEGPYWLASVNDPRAFEAARERLRDDERKS